MIHVKIELKLNDYSDILDAVKHLLMLVAQDIDNPCGYQITDQEDQECEIVLQDFSLPKFPNPAVLPS